MPNIDLNYPQIQPGRRSDLTSLYGLLYDIVENGPKPDFFREIIPNTSSGRVFSSNSDSAQSITCFPAILQPFEHLHMAHHPFSPENDWISRFEPILKNLIFWRFWTSRMALNNGDIQLLTSNSDSAQSITPIREFWAQCLVIYMVFQVPQKCDFRPSR